MVIVLLVPKCWAIKEPRDLEQPRSNSPIVLVLSFPYQLKQPFIKWVRIRQLTQDLYRQVKTKRFFTLELKHDYRRWGVGGG